MSRCRLAGRWLHFAPRDRTWSRPMTSCYDPASNVHYNKLTTTCEKDLSFSSTIFPFYLTPETQDPRDVCFSRSNNWTAPRSDPVDSRFLRHDTTDRFCNLRSCFLVVLHLVNLSHVMVESHSPTRWATLNFLPVSLARIHLNAKETRVGMIGRDFGHPPTILTRKK